MGFTRRSKQSQKKITTIALQEAINNNIEFLTGDEAKKAREEAKKFDYRKLLEERKKEMAGEDLTEFEKDLKVYLHERESKDKRTLEGLFGEKREEDSEE